MVDLTPLTDLLANCEVDEQRMLLVELIDGLSKGYNYPIQFFESGEALECSTPSSFAALSKVVTEVQKTKENKRKQMGDSGEKKEMPRHIAWGRNSHRMVGLNPIEVRKNRLRKGLSGAALVIEEEEQNENGEPVTSEPKNEPKNKVKCIKLETDLDIAKKN